MTIMIILDYLFTVYAPPPEPSSFPYWIIGAVLGGILVLVAIIWIILFIYFKCTRPQAATTTKRSGKVGDSKTSLVPGDKPKQVGMGFNLFVCCLCLIIFSIVPKINI